MNLQEATQGFSKVKMGPDYILEWRYMNDGRVRLTGAVRKLKVDEIFTSMEDADKYAEPWLNRK